MKVGADWRPDGWLADFDNMTPHQAEERVVTARDALAALHQVKAVSEAELDESEIMPKRHCRGWVGIALTNARNWNIAPFAGKTCVARNRATECSRLNWPAMSVSLPMHRRFSHARIAISRCALPGAR